MIDKRRYWKRFLVVILGLFFLAGVLYLVLRVETKGLDAAARKKANGEFVELSDGWVHYHFEGQDDGPVIVLVHGFSVPSYVWDPTFTALKEAGYQVLSFDLYGRGYSDRPDVEYDINLFQTQLSELLSVLEVDGPVHLVGLSMGGPIVARFASSHSDMVKSVTLISPVVVQVTPGETFPLNLPGVGEYLMSTLMEPIVLPRLQTADFFHPENFPGWEEEYRVQLQYHGTGRALLSTIRNLIELDPEHDYMDLEATGLPVFLVWGKEDQSISKEHIQVLQGILPAMEVQIIEEAGHLSHYEQPDQVNPVLLEFLSRSP